MQFPSVFGRLVFWPGLVLCLSVGAAAACSCAQPRHGVIEQLRRGAIVAEGAPAEVSVHAPEAKTPEGRKRYEFVIFRSIGATLPERIFVETADNSAACGVNLSGRKTALLRLLEPAARDPEGIYFINLCSQLSVDGFEADWRTLLDAIAGPEPR